MINGTDNFEVREFANQIDVGESEYTKFDRAVCSNACAWMRAHGNDQSAPWVMFVSFISPHYPLIAPREFYDLYDDESIGLPHRMEEVDIFIELDALYVNSKELRTPPEENVRSTIPPETKIS
ncbi:MAG: hypothetical protein GY785_21630 [Gammaproteobacteria bacterium]|nr:hypothetical protein [Gammaproteobacteria bacterium]